MDPDFCLEEFDLQIIHALQVEPRVAWNTLAGTLGSDAGTLARRWSRLESAGLAWITAHRPSRAAVGAIVELGCDPGRVLEAADEAGKIPAIWSLDLTAGRSDLIATLVARDDAELADYVLDGLGHIPGVRFLRSHIVNEGLWHGSDWNVHALTPAQVGSIPPPRRPRRGATKRVQPELARDLRHILERNGRTSYRELGEMLGISPQRASDALALLRSNGELILRTDVTSPISGWPAAAWYFVQAPAASIADVRTAVAEMKTVQYAGVTSGPSNLVIAAAARSKQELLQIEKDLERRIPRSWIQDRSQILRGHKKLGRLLDRTGRATLGLVPLP